MSGITDLNLLLSSLNPKLTDSEYVFLTRTDVKESEFAKLEPIATFREAEGLTLIVPRTRAEDAGENYDGVFRMITLQVHSSLSAVGLTALVATSLAKKGISANVVAAFYHDHIFVPAERAADAMDALHEIRARSASE